MTSPAYAQTFRGLPACPCQVTWIPALEHELRRQEIIQGTLGIAQMIGLYEASGNTHGDPNGAGLRKGGGFADFWLTGRTADRAVVVMRQMGAPATWRRPPNWDHDGGSEHVHSGMRGCPHATVQGLAQIWAVEHNGDGLVGNAPDPGPRPVPDRTWREGIEWAKEQETMDEERTREIVREELAKAGSLDNVKVDVGGENRIRLSEAFKRLFERTSAQ